MGLYHEAIEALNKAIEKDPSNKEAHFQRAIAYFETGSFDLALNDYLSSEKGEDLIHTVPLTLSENSYKEFSESLLTSMVAASVDAAIEFVPSMCYSVYGAGEALWTNWVKQQSRTPIVDDIAEVQQLAQACYEMGEYFADYWKSVDGDTTLNCVEQLRALGDRFDELSPSEKGELIGGVIGTYGVDIFAGGAVIKGISTFKKLRDANRICNLEMMALSQAHKESIVATALEHNAQRASFFENVTIHWDRQNKHIPGKHNYIEGRGILTHANPQKLIKEFAGTGIPKNMTQPGIPGYVERVDFKQVIGYWIDEAQPHIKLPTTKGTIKYSKKGAHIVPSDPNG